MARQIGFASVALAIGTLACGATAAEVTVLHYVSTDDFAMPQDGQLTAIHEYVEITLDPDGPDRIEVGYQHWGRTPLSFLQDLGSEYSTYAPQIPDMTAADLGRIDLVDLRRIAMTGTVDIGPETLTWEVGELTPTPAQGPADLATGGSWRPSPFQVAGERITVGRHGGSETELGDSLIIVADGEEHSYRRVDPEALSLTGFLSILGDNPIIRSRDCMAPIAEAYLAGEPYPFSAEAIAETEYLLEGEPGLALLQQRGYGVALNHYLDDALPARRAAGELLSAEVDRLGLEQAILANGNIDGLSDAQRALRDQMFDMSRVVAGMHILPGDDRFPDGPMTRDQFRALMLESTEAYHAAPWSQTGFFTNVMAESGWVEIVADLLWQECFGR